MTKKISSTEKPKEMVQPVQMFHNYKMYFLKEEINMKLVAPVKLIPTKFQFLSGTLSMIDVKTIDDVFKRIDSNLSCNQHAWFNNRYARFYDAFDEISFKENENWYITIAIQGYKVDNNDVYSPIWKIMSARLSQIF